MTRKLPGKRFSIFFYYILCPQFKLIIMILLSCKQIHADNSTLIVLLVNEPYVLRTLAD